MFKHYLVCVASACALCDSVVARDIPGTLNNANGNVTWGPTSVGDPVDDTLPRRPGQQSGSYLSFMWTSGHERHPDYREYVEPNTQDVDKDRHFKRPVPAAGRPAITDWLQVVGYTDSLGREKGASSVHSGNIQNGADSWVFAPLDELDGIFGRIPDFGPSAASAELGLTVYAAVNLPLYLQNNPLGFSSGNWATGQTLDSTGRQIVNGQMAGLQGMYFATVPFGFDANSATGWVPSDGTSWLNSADWQAAHGDMVILGGHTIPAPGSAVCVAALGVLASRRRR